MNGIQAVTDLAVYLSNNTEIKVFKYEKQTGFNGEYLVVNSLPFAYGSPFNSQGTLNLNIHIPDLGSGLPNTKRLAEVAKMIMELISVSLDTEDSHPLEINGAFYQIESDSNVMRDEDNTHFINIVIKVMFNALNTE